MASTSSSVTSVTCSTTTYSNKLAKLSITAYCIASIASFSGSHPVVSSASPITAYSVVSTVGLSGTLSVTSATSSDTGYTAATVASTESSILLHTVSLQH